MSRVCIVESFAPPLLKNAPPKMTLHPLISKGGAFVLKLGLVFKKRRDTMRCLFFFGFREGFKPTSMQGSGGALPLGGWTPSAPYDLPLNGHKSRAFQEDYRADSPIFPAGLSVCP